MSQRGFQAIYSVRPTTRLSHLIVVLVGLALFLGPVLCRARDGEARYKDPEHNFALTVPSGWTRKTDMARPYVAFLGPQVEGFVLSINVFTEPAANKTLAQYVKVSKDTIAKSKEMRLQGEARTTLGGAPARTLRSTVTITGHPSSIVRQVVAVHGDRGYVVTFTAPPSATRQYLQAFNRLLVSFHFIDAAGSHGNGNGNGNRNEKTF